MSEFGLFGRLLEKIEKENEILTEGLITSYPFSNVLTMLNLKYKNVITHIQADPIKSNKGTTKTRGISMYVKKSDLTEDLKNRLSKDLMTYGYFISFVENFNIFEKGIFIEPKFPFVVEPKYLKNKKFFHTTNVKNLEKIEKIGLTPKASQTSFSHEGNRIYIMASDSVEVMNNLKNIIAKNKNYKPDDMVILEIDPTAIKFYIDPNFDDTSNHTSLFTFQNIPPSAIKVV
jgi:hypothetical protein